MEILLPRGRPDQAGLASRGGHSAAGHDRIIFRVEAGTIFFYDIVKHDDITRYSKRPRGVR